MKGIAYFDGGSRNNPGQAATACFLFDENLKLLDFNAKYFNKLTNNQAEYEGLLLTIKIAQKNNINELDIYSDSELVVKQLKGEYKIKNPEIKTYYSKYLILTHEFKKINITHVTREKNIFPDKLVNLILDTIAKHE